MMQRMIFIYKVQKNQKIILRHICKLISDHTLIVLMISDHEHLETVEPGRGNDQMIFIASTVKRKLIIMGLNQQCHYTR